MLPSSGIKLDPILNPDVVADIIADFGLDPTDVVVMDMFPRFDGWGLEGIFVAYRAARYFSNRFSCTLHEAITHVNDITSGVVERSWSIPQFRELLTQSGYNEFVIGDPDIRLILAATKWVLQKYETVVMAMVVRQHSLVSQGEGSN